MSAKPSIMTRQTRIGEPKGWDFPADMCEHKKDVPRYYEKGDGSGGLLTRCVEGAGAGSGAGASVKNDADRQTEFFSYSSNRKSVKRKCEAGDYVSNIG